MQEVLAELSAQGKEFDIFCCILPTACFIRAQTLQESFRLLVDPLVDSIMPIVAFEYPVPRALQVKKAENGDDVLQMVWPENIEVRSQDCEPWYHDVGQFYWMRVAYFNAEKPKWLIGKHTKPFEISPCEVQDIDTPDDWKMAELKYTLLQQTLQEEAEPTMGMPRSPP